MFFGEFGVQFQVETSPFLEWNRSPLTVNSVKRTRYIEIRNNELDEKHVKDENGVMHWLMAGV